MATRSDARLLVLAWACLCLPSGRAAAHDVRGSAVYLDLGRSAVAVELHLPIAQLQLALPLSDAELARPTAPRLRAYLREHVRASSRDGSETPLAVQSAVAQDGPEGGELVVSGLFDFADAEHARAFSLRYDAIVEHVVTHNAYVFVRRDVWTGRLGEQPQLLGMLHWQRKQLSVDRRAGSAWQGLCATFQLGVRHIAEGLDHLLFLVMLLLPAPLLAAHARWSTRRSIKESGLAIVKLVTAFTVGHSITLLVGAVQGAALPVQPVEILIAASIVISALHAIRPIFPGRESFIAAGFGLVHGLAFASALRGFGYDSGSLALALLGFNLGIEAMQLVVVLVVMPWLVLTAHHPTYGWLRTLAASLGVVAGTGWIAERSFGSTNTPGLWVEHIATRAPLLLGALALYALAINAGRVVSLIRPTMATRLRS